LVSNIRTVASPTERLRKEQLKYIKNSTVYWIIDAFIAVSDAKEVTNRPSLISFLNAVGTLLPEILAELHTHGIKNTEELRGDILYIATQLKKVV